MRTVLLAIGLSLLISSAHSESLKQILLSGHHDQLAMALEQGADPNERLPDGSRPLAWAAELQDAAAVALLLRYGASVDDADPNANPMRPLIAACLHPDDEVLGAMLAQRPDVDVTGPESIPALAFCAAHAPTAVVRRLVKRGADVNAASDSGQTPLMWAAAHGRDDNFELLLKHGADLNARTTRGFNAYLFAIKSGSTSLPTAAIAAGANPHTALPDGTTALQLALYQGNYETARQLIDAGGDISAFDVNGRQPLHIAAQHGQRALAEQLIRAGASVNQTNIASSVPWRYESNFRAGDYNFPVQTPLLFAAANGNASLMQLLREAGADTAARCDAENNVVLWAAQGDNAEALSAALTMAPDVHAANNSGDTALHVVLQRHTGSTLENMLSVLAQHGADPDRANAADRTPRQIAADPAYQGRDVFDRFFPPIKVTQR